MELRGELGAISGVWDESRDYWELGQRVNVLFLIYLFKGIYVWNG